MTYSSSPYVDGDFQKKQRGVFGTGDNTNPHYTGVILPASNYDEGRIKTVNPQYVTLFHSATADTTLKPVYTQDTRNLKFLSMRVDHSNGSGALNDFRVDVSFSENGDFWEEIASGDYFFTTGTGEAEGNEMKLIRKVSPVNPRTLPLPGSTWLQLYVESYSYVRVRASKISGTSTLDFRAYATYL